MSGFGVNKFEEDDASDPELFEIDAAEHDRLCAELKTLRAERNNAVCDKSLDELKRACEGSDNLLPHLMGCVEAGATIGEICAAMETVIGVYTE